MSCSVLHKPRQSYLWHNGYYMKNFFSTLVPHIIDSFRGWKIWLHVAAIASTAVIVLSGFDWVYFQAVRSPLLNTILFPAVVIGLFVPILVPLAMLALGTLRRNERLVRTAWTIGQAALIGFLISITYKALTGRIQPNMMDTVIDISRGFRFGFLRGGVFWGWPSSHTTVAFASSIALAYSYPKNKIVLVCALLYAFYIGLGVSIGIHWFSEFVAGVFVGTAVGLAVGQANAPRQTPVS